MIELTYTYNGNTYIAPEPIMGYSWQWQVNDMYRIRAQIEVDRNRAWVAFQETDDEWKLKEYREYTREKHWNKAHVEKLMEAYATTHGF